MPQPSPSFEIERLTDSLVVGAGSGIGFALVDQLLQRSDSIVFATYHTISSAAPLLALAQEEPRLRTFQVDATQEVQVAALFAKIRNHTKSLDFVANCVGILHDGDLQPEKTILQVDVKSLVRYFLINAAVTPLLAKYALPFLRGPSLSLFASISARVGSIGDNKLGGWYGYRASKASMNMFLRTFALEVKTARSNCIVLALHPGTTRTALSAPFISRTRYTVHEPTATAKNLLQVLAGKTMNDTGLFFAWDGEPVEW